MKAPPAGPSDASTATTPAGSTGYAPPGALAFAHPPQAVAALLRAMVPPPPPSPRKLRALRWLLVAAVLGGGAAALAVDQSLAYPRGAFAWLVPFSWLGAGVVLNALHPRPRRTLSRPNTARLALGCVLLAVAGVVAALALSVFALPFAAGGPAGRSWGLWIAGSLIAVGVGLFVARLLSAPEQPHGAPRLTAAARLAEALADDAAPGKPASGWLDVSGAEQPAKRVRETTARSGVKVTLFRDEWVRLRLHLRDGNRLRVSAVDRVKVRAGRFKRARSGKSKWKPGRTDRLGSVELRLAVNPAVYRVKDATAQTPPLLTAVLPGGGDGFAAEKVVAAVAHLYAQLERVKTK